MGLYQSKVKVREPEDLQGAGGGYENYADEGDLYRVQRRQ